MTNESRDRNQGGDDDSSTQRHVEELLPAYATDALDADEQASVETHLTTCPACQESLASYQEAVHNLAALLPRRQPPARLRASVMARVAPTAPVAAPPTPLREQPQPHRASWLPIGAGTAAGLVLGVALGVSLALIQVRGDLNENERAITELRETLQQGRIVSYLAASPETPVFVLNPTAEDTRTYAMLMGSPSNPNWAMFVAGGMEEPPKGKAYQLWLINDGQRESGGVFTVDETGWAQVEVRPSLPVTDLDGLGVTVEPTSGSPGPTSPPVLSWRPLQ